MHVSEDQLHDIFRLAEEQRRESVDLFHFTQLLRENLSREQRLRLVEAIWGVVYSDGPLAEVEGHLARRIAELLGFQHPEVQAVREKVKQQGSDATGAAVLVRTLRRRPDEGLVSGLRPPLLRDRRGSRGRKSASGRRVGRRVVRFRVVTDPGIPGVVYTEAFRSLDGGMTWQSYGLNPPYVL